MPSLTGVVTIVQAGRFQLVDDRGAAHLFILGPGAGAETRQIELLSRRQARVRVAYTEVAHLIGLRADRVDLLDPAPPAPRTEAA